MYFPWWVVVVIRQQNVGPMHDQSSVHHAPTMPEGLPQLWQKCDRLHEAFSVLWYRLCLRPTTKCYL